MPSGGISIFGRSVRSVALLKKIEWSLRYVGANNRAIFRRPPLDRQIEGIARFAVRRMPEAFVSWMIYLRIGDQDADS